jgi:LemA protein
MVMEPSDQERLSRMLREGKISQSEADRLRQSFNTQTKQKGNRNNSTRHRLVMLLVISGVFFALGIIGGALMFEAPSPSSMPVTPHTTSSETRDQGGRLIDLGALQQERSKTMQNARTFSYSIFIVIIVAGIGVAILLIYNGLVDSREKVNAGWAQVENQYQRRLDLVPVLIDGVKTYMEHERETLAELTEARATALGVASTFSGQPPQTVEQMRALEASQGKVQSAIARLFAVVENYPDLKASQNFLALQDQIEGTENRIAVERRNYNEWSRSYNARIQKFPSNVVADSIGFEPKPYFQAETAAMQSLKDPFGRESE